MCVYAWCPVVTLGSGPLPAPSVSRGFILLSNRPCTVKEFQNSNGVLSVRLSGGHLHITPAGPEASGHAPAFIVLVVFAKLCSGLVAGEPQGRPSPQSSRGRISPVVTGEQWSPACPQGSPSPRPGFISGEGGSQMLVDPSPGSSVTTLLGSFRQILPPGNSDGHPQILAGP